MNKTAFKYDPNDILPTTYIKTKRRCELMTLVVAAKFKDGILVKSDSLGIHSTQTKDNEVAVEETITQQKIFQLTRTAVISAAGSFHRQALTVLATMTNMYFRCGNNRFSDAVHFTRDILNALLADSRQSGEVMIAGYDDETHEFKISAIKLDGGVVSTENFSHYHAIGTKAITDYLLRSGKAGVEGLESSDEELELIEIATDNLFLGAALEEKDMMKRDPKTSWHIGGKLQEWLITAADAKQRANSLPPFKVRVRSGDAQNR